MTVEITRETIDRYNRPGPRYTSYPTVPHWSNTFTAEDYLAALHDVAVTNDPISVYVHLPFCAERCAYCGCNATSTRRSSVVDQYLDRLERELAMITAHLSTGRRVVQLHWGGGTPNFLNEAQTRRLMGLLRAAFTIDPDAEVALEVDPRIGNREQVFLFRELGFNRISFGVQDIAQEVQIAIGRIQPLWRLIEYPWATRALDVRRGDLVVDIGSGTSSFPHMLAKEGVDVVVLELDPDRVRWQQAKRVATARPGDGRFFPLVASATAMPFRSDTVSRIAAVSTLEHIPDDEAVGREIGRVLAPGGIAVITIPYTSSERTGFFEGIRRFKRVARNAFVQEGKAGSFFRFYTDDDIQRVYVQPAGLQISPLRGFGRSILNWRYHETRLTRFWRTFILKDLLLPVRYRFAIHPDLAGETQLPHQWPVLNVVQQRDQPELLPHRHSHRSCA